MDQPNNETPEEAPRAGAVVKRRWAIMSKAGGGAAVIAIVGALAAGAPDGNPATPAGSLGGDVQERIADA